MAIESVNEKGTVILQATFADEDGQAATPSSVTWTLTDAFGTIINNRDGISVTPASTITIVLTGDDLAVLDPKSLRRYVCVTAVYDSSAGANLSITDEYEFELKDLKGKS